MTALRICARQYPGGLDKICDYQSLFPFAGGSHVSGRCIENQNERETCKITTARGEMEPAILW